MTEDADFIREYIKVQSELNEFWKDVAKRKKELYAKHGYTEDTFEVLKARALAMLMATGKDSLELDGYRVEKWERSWWESKPIKEHNEPRISLHKLEG